MGDLWTKGSGQPPTPPRRRRSFAAVAAGTSRHALRPAAAPLLLTLLGLLALLPCPACGGPASKALTVTLTTTMLPEVLPPPLTGAAAGAVGGYGGGVITQHLKLLALITLGLHLKVDRILIPAVASRVAIEGQHAQWQAEPPNSLWDMRSIDLLLHKHGVKMVPASTHLPPPGSHVLPSYFFRAMTINAAADDVRLFCRHQLQLAPTNNLTLVAPDLLLSLRTSQLKLYKEVVATVRFADPLLNLAQTVTGLLRNRSAIYNGVQFRLDGRLDQAGIQLELAAYLKYMTQLSFGSVPLYVSSGIFAEGGKGHYSTVANWLHESAVGQGHASVVLNRHVVLRHHETALAQLSQLHTEQRAAVDFLVLLNADKVVGSRASSFAFILREFRALNNVSRTSVGIVGDPWWLLPVAAGVLVR